MRNSVTPGWLGFWELRVKPQGDYRLRQHGNTRHGRYSKGRMTWRQILSGPPVDVPLGWRVYPTVRRSIASKC